VAFTPPISMSDYKQVIVTINKVTVLNTGSTATCDVLTTMTTPSTPLTINIANLSNVLQLLSVADALPCLTTGSISNLTSPWTS